MTEAVEIPRADGGNSLDHYNTDAIRGFIRMFEQMRARPRARKGDVPLPVLSLHGPFEVTAAFAQILAARCKGAPNAWAESRAGEHAGSEAGAPYLAMSETLLRVARTLSSTGPGKEPQLRFPLFHQVHWMLGMQLPGDTPQAVRELVARETRRRRLQLRPSSELEHRGLLKNLRAYFEGPLSAWAAAAALVSQALAEQLSPVIGLVAVCAALVLAVVHVLLLSRSWAGWRRYRWFTRQPYLMPESSKTRPQSFREFVELVLKARHKAEVPASLSEMSDRGQREPRRECDEIELLLVNAFLEDLRQGYERSRRTFWRRAAWTRTVYPVLLVDTAGEADVNARLLRRVEQVRRQIPQSDPLFVIHIAAAECGDPIGRAGTAPAAYAEVSGAERLWTEWNRSLRASRAVGDVRHLGIRLKREDARAADAVARSIPLEQPPRPPLLANRWLLRAAILLLFLGPAAVLAREWQSSCGKGVWKAPTGECVGITSGDVSFDERFAEVVNAIEDNNGKIERSGRPYTTIVYVGALSTQPSSAAEDLADAQGELTGIAIRQGELLESADQSIVQLRVLIANAGNGFRFGEQVADRILELARDDASIAGAIGFGESRDGANAAINRLSSIFLPMLGTAATYDDFGKDGKGRPSLSYFPLSPTNSEVADVSARWARSGALAAPADDGLPHKRPARTAAVFVDADSSDLYSSDIGRRFMKRFGELGGKATLVEYDDAGDAGEELKKLCKRDAEQPDLVFYSGRSTQFGTFVDRISSSPCEGLLVLAGDAVSQYVDGNAARIAMIGKIKLYYTPLATEKAWPPGDIRRPAAFYDALWRRTGPPDDGGVKPSPTYAVLAYDAARAMMDAAQSTYRLQHDPGGDGRGPAVDRGGLLAAFGRLDEIDGASGLISFEQDPSGNRAVDRPLLLATVSTSGGIEVVGQCGRLYEQAEPCAMAGRPGS
ncbi:hypothetical protein [Nonomuraea rubra]|uniref:hypothetical protein n=1 Tax=Nonomuraea rubra TaxID=46180 RepID=UPI003407A16C